MIFKIVHGCHSRFKRRTLPYDRLKIGDHACDIRFEQLCSPFAGVPYLVHNTSHCHIVGHRVLNAATVAYPYTKRNATNRDPGLPQETFPKLLITQMLFKSTSAPL